MPSLDAPAALAALRQAVGLPAEPSASVRFTGTTPGLPSSFPVGVAAQAAIAAAASSALDLAAVRGAPPRTLTVDRLDALLECRSERALRIDGVAPVDPWDPLAGLYRTGDDGWVRLHTNFPHHRAGVLALLGCEGSREEVGRALVARSAEAFEDEASAAGLCVAALRSFEQWDRHPQGRALATQPWLQLQRLDDASARPLPPLPPCAPPLHRVRVVELTRVIAGPVAGRTLARHGADVLLISAPHLPSIETLVIDTGRGKRSARLDLRDANDRATLLSLVSDADVFLQSYRPGALDALGFDPLSLSRQRPGLVVASLSAYGPAGPWKDRRGFDSLVQTAMGFNHAEAQAARQASPRALPAQMLDHASGLLLAFGIAEALRRRVCEGGSWHLQVSLAQTGAWLRALGRLPEGLDTPEPSPEDVEARLDTVPSAWGTLRMVRHAARVHGLPLPLPGLSPPVPLGRHEARWW